MIRFATLGLGLALSAGALAGGTVSHTFDLAGASSDGGSWGDNFPTMVHNFGASGAVVLVEFNLNFTANSPSWASEPIIIVDALADGTGDYLVIDPYEYGAPDASGFFQYSDSIATYLNSDGVVSLTLFEYFDDAISPDAVYGDGSFVRVHYSGVPTPGAAAGILGAAGFAGLRRRR